jgi:GcrA cell cycle regulator
MEWSKERVEILKRMWAEGASARLIAEALGGDATRNSVIGKAYRLGLSKPSKPPKRASEPPNRPLASILNLTERMCRWPSGHPGQAGFGFCGKPVAPGRPYCAEHCAKAYAPRRDSAA